MSAVTVGTMEDFERRAQFVQDTLDKMGYPSETAKKVLGILRMITEAIKTISNLGEDAKRFIKKALETLVELITDPEKGYIFVTNKFAATANTIARIVGLQTRIPEKLQPKCNEIKLYLEKAKALMAEADQEANKMAAKIELACENRFVITDIEMKELQRAQIKLRSKIKICGEYLSTCHEVLEDLESEVRQHILWLGLGTIVSVISTKYVFQQALAKAECIADLTAALLSAEATPGLSAATTDGAVDFFLNSALGIGGAFISCKLLAILCDYSQVLLVDCEKVKSELRMMNTRLKELQTRDMELQEEMSLLEISK